MDELADDMMSHGCFIPCPYSIVLAGDTVSIEHDDFEWSTHSDRHHSLARLFGLALSILRWF